jgi:pilus assembly protein Flp/PilA
MVWRRISNRGPGTGSNGTAKIGVKTMNNFIVNFLKEEDGQDLVEYALIVAAVGLALISTVSQLGQAISSLYTSITGDLSSIGTTQ